MNEHYPFVNPPLPYAYDALEPFIDTKTMELHHDRHLQTYVDNLNKALKDYPAYQYLSLEQLIAYIPYLPPDIQTAVRNNAGGVYNHIFYFSNLTNESTVFPPNQLISYLASYFGSLTDFQNEFSQAALSVFGSGYAWLVLDSNNTPQIVTTANQDTPLSQNLCPILNIDVWEHAYYLKHYNERINYIKDWFRVVNWDNANAYFINCMTMY